MSECRLKLCTGEARWCDLHAPDGVEFVLRAVLKVSDSVDIGCPEVGTDPNGMLTLDWQHARDRVLTVALDPDGTVYHALLLGQPRSKGRGTGVTAALLGAMTAYRDATEAADRAAEEA